MYASRVFQEYNTDHPETAKQWKPVTDIEVKAFIGLLIPACVYKSNQEHLDELWCVKTGRPMFRATMSLKRFQ